MERVSLIREEKDGLLVVGEFGQVSNLSVKSSRVNRNSLCLVSKSQASPQGLGSGGDYFVVAHADRPSLQFFHFGKSEPILHVSTQEICSVVATDRLGTLLICGTGKGNIFVWDLSNGELVATWLAHFKAVSQIAVSLDNEVLVTVGDDGLARAWKLAHALDRHNSSSSEVMQPFRAWSEHTLGISGLVLLNSSSTIRAWTCSLDRHVCLHDVLENRTILRLTLPEGLECMASIGEGSAILVGGHRGGLYVIDNSLVLSSNSNSLKVVSSKNFLSSQPLSSRASQTEECLPRGVLAFPSMHGDHAIVQLMCLPDQIRFISADASGKLCWWDLLTQQCLQVSQVSTSAITNMVLMRKPDEGMVLTSGKGASSTQCPLKKYISTTQPDPQITLTKLNNAATARQAKKIAERIRTWEQQLSFLAMDSKEVLDGAEAEVGSSEEISDMMFFPPMLQERTTTQDESNALEDAQKRVAELEKDNARWKELCFKMQQQIETQMVSKNNVVAQSGEYESKHAAHHSQEDVGDAPDVVFNGQQQDAGKKIKNKRKRASG
eukprot:scaffold94_cov242-Ochromonas_danica.AAC.3